MWWQSLPGWICTFCQWRHPVLPAVSFFLIILHSQYMTSSFAFTFFLGVQELGMGSEVEAASLFCLFVSLDDPPLLACVGTEKRERVGKGKSLLYFHLSDSLEHKDNIKTGPITYRSYQEPQRVDPSFLSVIHPTALGESMPFLSLVCQFMKSPVLHFFLYTLVLPSELKQWPIPCD